MLSICATTFLQVTPPGSYTTLPSNATSPSVVFLCPHTTSGTTHSPLYGDIVLFDMPTMKYTNITNDAFFDHRPRLSPDASMLLYQSHRRGNALDRAIAGIAGPNDLYCYDVHTRQERILLEDHPDQYDSPEWESDSTILVVQYNKVLRITLSNPDPTPVFALPDSIIISDLRVCGSKSLCAIVVAGQNSILTEQLLIVGPKGTDVTLVLGNTSTLDLSLGGWHSDGDRFLFIKRDTIFEFSASTGRSTKIADPSILRGLRPFLVRYLADSIAFLAESGADNCPPADYVGSTDLYMFDPETGITRRRTFDCRPKDDFDIATRPHSQIK